MVVPTATVKTEEPRRIREQIRKVSAEIIELLRMTPASRITAEAASAVLAAVATCDREKALAAITSARNAETKVSAPPELLPKAPLSSPPTPTFTTQLPAPWRAEQPIGPAIDADIAGFAPRDRIAKNEPSLPENAYLMVNFLRQRALREIERGSIAGALDHALDILQLAAKANQGREYWSQLALTILAALPSFPEADVHWGKTLSDALNNSLGCLNDSTLPNYVSNLLTQPNFEESIADRLVYEEVAPFADVLTAALYSAVMNDRLYLLEDVARGIGMGAAYGNVGTAKRLLIELARRAGEEAQTITRIQGALDGQAAAYVEQRATVPEWIAEGVMSYKVALIERAKQLNPTALSVTVPRSVSSSGGFGLLPGSEDVEFALLISNQRNRSVSAVELALPMVRNPWLAQDVICATRPINANARHLVRVSAKLARELTEDARLELGLSVRYKEPGSRETKFLDPKIEVGFAKSRSLDIKNYEGASGKPLILVGNALNYSGNTVRKALTEILAGLMDKGVASLVIGRRRRGKTSILQTVAWHDEVKARYSIITDSWEDLPSRSLADTLKHLGNLFDRAARILNVEIDSLELRIGLETARPWSVVQQWLVDLTTRLTVETRLLLLIDEFQKWISLLEPEQRSRVLSLLRGLFNRPEGGKLSISIVLSGLTNIREFTRSSADFENAFRVFKIEAFSLGEADQLIRSNPSIEFDSRAVARIRDLAGGNPFLINLLGNDIAGRLRDHGRAYCLPEDVEKVVQGQLEDKQSSRVWSFLQYLLKEGEEDHAAEISELPSLLAMAHAFRARGPGRKSISLDEIVSKMQEAHVSCDKDTLISDLDSAVRDELVIRNGSRYAFANGWLAEWLSLDAQLLPVEPQHDKDLVLNRFRLVEFIDQGGQAKVWEAEDVHHFNRRVVVKIYPRIHHAGVGSAVIREAELLSSIEHHAVVSCIAFGVDPAKGDVIVLERVKGETLRQLLNNRPTHAVELVGMTGDLKVQVKFIEQIAAALCECHRMGVVHKDLKPENIMVMESAGIWLPKIIDFGLATNFSELSQDLRTLGSYTPGYVAPERYRGEGRRAPADIYSLGVITYELLTGTAPFPSDSLQAREAQETANFIPAKDRRIEITTCLSELIGEMMALSPTDRPNAFTLMGRLAAALQTGDWMSDYETGKHAYGMGDAETAFNFLERAAFGAPEQGRRSREYLEVLGFLIDAADSCGKTLAVAPELMQPMLAAAVKDSKSVEAFDRLVAKVISEQALEPQGQDFQKSAIRTLVELLSDLPPAGPLIATVQRILKYTDHPAIWGLREEIYLIGLEYKDAELIDLGLLGSWCIKSAKKMRERDSTLLSAQVWLRRAERLGLGLSTEYRKEQEIVDKLLRKTATPAVLPQIPSTQEPASKTVGDGEKAHLNVGRITGWVRRLLLLHPYVQEVRRVRKDPNLPLSPTRLLSLDNIGQHLTPSIGVLESTRIVPAVLDESYCIPKGSTALRINIVLPSGTTIAQREAAIRLLRDDTSLFGQSAG